MRPAIGFRVLDPVALTKGADLIPTPTISSSSQETSIPETTEPLELNSSIGYVTLPNPVPIDSSRWTPSASNSRRPYWLCEKSTLAICITVGVDLQSILSLLDRHAFDPVARTPLTVPDAVADLSTTLPRNIESRNGGVVHVVQLDGNSQNGAESEADRAVQRDAIHIEQRQAGATASEIDARDHNFTVAIDLQSGSVVSGNDALDTISQTAVTDSNPRSPFPPSFDFHPARNNIDPRRRWNWSLPADQWEIS